MTAMVQPAAAQRACNNPGSGSRGGGGRQHSAATAPRRSAGSQHCRGRAVRAPASPSGATPQQQDAASLDVSGAVVQPSFRSTPWAAEAAFAAEGANRAAARIAFISESGTCRAPLAAAAFERLLEERGLTSAGIQCECRATRDFNLGDPADPSAAAVAAELGLQLPPGYQAQQFKEARDIVDFDVVLVMDKFTAADVLREVGG